MRDVQEPSHRRWHVRGLLNGGLELALHGVFGAEPAWFAEFEAAPSRILGHHWPDVPNHGDVTAIDWSAVEPVDIIAGGSPCQDLSHAGKRAGMKAGTRSGLWASMCDAIDIIRPRLVVWENVRGALNAEATAGDVESCDLCVGDGSRVHLRALGRVLGDLAELGYDAAWTGLRAADVGAPHGRWRVFVVAWPQSDPSALTWPQSDPSALLPTPAVNDMGRAYSPDEWDAWTERMKAAHGNGNGHGASLSIEALRLLPSPRTSDTNGAGVHGDGGLDLRTAVSLLPTPKATNNKNRQSEGFGGGRDGNFHELVTGRSLWSDYAPAIARWEPIIGRPAPSPTEPTGKGGAHRLSPRFVEFMMGLLSGWVTDPAIWEGMKPSAARNAQLKALGNGVVPQQGAEGVRRCIAIARAGLAVAA